MESCSFCGKFSKLVDSHALPKYFFCESNPAERLTLVLRSLHAFNHRKRIPKGIYGRIFCFECEKRFNTIDNLGIENLKKDIETNHKLNQKNYTYTPSFNCSQVNRFIYSVLFRAHYLSQKGIDYYSCVKLDSHLNHIKEYIFGETLNKNYSCIVHRKSSGAIKPILSPSFKRQIMDNNLNHYILRTENYNFFAKVDQRDWPEPFRNIHLLADNPLVLKSDIYDQEMDFIKSRIKKHYR